MNTDEIIEIGEETPQIRKKRSRFGYRVAVIGGGSWATAIIKILSTNLKHIHWWVREPEIEESVNKFGHNPLYLSSVEINPRDVKVTTNIKRAIAKADYIVIVTPSHSCSIRYLFYQKLIYVKRKLSQLLKGLFLKPCN